LRGTVVRSAWRAGEQWRLAALRVQLAQDTRGRSKVLPGKICLQGSGTVVFAWMKDAN